MSTVEFDATVVALARKLRAFIRRRVNDDATADDLAQETLLRVYRSRAVLRDGQRLEAWLFRIARRTVIDHYRRRRPGEQLPESLTVEPPDELAAFRGTVVAAMTAFLDDLPTMYREPVRLAEIEGLPLAKIALRLDLSLTAVKSRVRRGRGLLKRALQACCRLEFDRHGRVIAWENRCSVPCAC